MSKLADAHTILEAMQVPTAQQSDVCCYALLAISGIKEEDDWSSSSDQWIRIHDIIVFLKEHYGVVYAENSRETIRKQALHHFRNAAFIEDNGSATNSPNYRYRLTGEMLALLQSFGTSQWDAKLEAFLSKHGSLMQKYERRRSMNKLPVVVNGEELVFSPGKHNQLQKAIIEEFAPRFAPNASCLYVGDTSERDLFKDERRLADLGMTITLHDKMPDVVLYSDDKDVLYLIEAVTSVGPMEPKRIIELTEMTKDVRSRKIFITAFIDFATYKRFASALAWETEVWIAEIPDHMIHMNGDKFL